MRQTARLILPAVCLLFLGAALKVPSTRSPKTHRAVVYAAATPSAAACQFPTHPAATPQETAWQMFTAANCPWQQGNGAMQAVWESWPTQEDVFTSGLQARAQVAVRNPSPARFHASFLQQALAKKTSARAHWSLALTPAPTPGAASPPRRLTGCCVKKFA